MKMRKLVLVILLSLFLLPLNAEVFYSSIINASYLSDFALNAFPVSFWGEFGIDKLDLVENLNTKALVRVEAGMAQRTLRQWPETGSVITDPDDQRRYSVVFSEGLVGFEQGLVTNPDETKKDFLTLSFLIGVRWEQAFGSLHDIQNGDFGGVFDDPIYFPENTEVVGVPELNGNKYSLSNSITIGLDFNNRYSHYLTPEGYDFSIDFVIGPWWLLNSPTIFNTNSYIDYWKMLYTASYTHTIMQQNQEDSEMNLFSLYMNFGLSCQIMFGKAIPQHEMSVNFRGKAIPPRPFITDIKASITLVGPEFLTVGTYPTVTLTMENALAAGTLLNSNEERIGIGFYGTVGARFDLYIMRLFRAYVGVYWDYLSPEGYRSGFDFDFGAYFTATF